MPIDVLKQILRSADCFVLVLLANFLLVKRNHVLRKEDCFSDLSSSKHASIRRFQHVAMDRRKHINYNLSKHSYVLSPRRN